MTDTGDTQRNIRLLIAYDGTDFSGWQRQGQGESGRGKNRTVQGTIEDALARIHKKDIVLTGSGRTDAGVHAVGQVANFFTPLMGMEAPRFVPALNSLLPRDVRILDARKTLGDFHARFDARSRTYRYYLICGRQAFPHELRYGLQLWRRPRLALLNDYARLFHGEMDCSLFASSQDQSLFRFRYIFEASFFAQQDMLVFEIRANAFLWKMVRSILGTLLYYEEKSFSPEEFKKILVSGVRKCAGPTVPPQGLFLWKIEYHRGG
ncbi:MAG: tRNA pseudouridine(38-40) synthase TruA [Spirochaetaceae bacterium]|jgi:tRNA pseudouridine38-40 synthase|nr:tRNA pseudouridine(38-40) synthase TruA [Spirochaetaceae bacterium]